MWAHRAVFREARRAQTPAFTPAGGRQQARLATPSCDPWPVCVSEAWDTAGQPLWCGATNKNTANNVEPSGHHIR